MPEGMGVTVVGQGLGAAPGDTLTVTTAAGVPVASAVFGKSASGMAVRAWSPSRVALYVPQQLTGPVTVTVRTQWGASAWTIGLPAGRWKSFLVWSGDKPAVAMEYFPPGAPAPHLASLNQKAQQDHFPASAAAAGSAAPGGARDPVSIWPVAAAAGYYLVQPMDLRQGVVPSGGYLIYLGRFFGDPLMGRFLWVRLATSPGPPAAFRHAARLQVLRTCTAPATAACPTVRVERTTAAHRPPRP